MKNQTSLLTAGYQAGQTADDAMSAFEMSPFEREFTMGYIVGFSSMQSFKMASHSVAAWTAGELAFRYGISVNELLPHLGFNEELKQQLRQAFNNERQNENAFD